jgi:hypothetical protein
MQVWRLPGREHVRQTRSGRKGRVVGRVKNFIGTHFPIASKRLLLLPITVCHGLGNWREATRY